MLNSLTGFGSKWANPSSASISGLLAARKLHEEVANHENRGDLDKAKECFETGIQKAEDLVQSNLNESELSKTREFLAASYLYYGNFLRQCGDKFNADAKYKNALEHAPHMDKRRPGVIDLYKQIGTRYGSFQIKDGNASQGSSNQLDPTKELVKHWQPSKNIPSRQNFTRGNPSSFVQNPEFEKHLSSLPKWDGQFFTQPLQAQDASFSYTLPESKQFLQETRHLAWCIQQAQTPEEKQLWIDEAYGVVEQFKGKKRLVHIQEVVALASIDHPGLHHKIINTLLDALKPEANRLVNSSLLQGLSVMMFYGRHLTDDHQASGHCVTLLRALIDILNKIHAHNNIEQTQTLLQTITILLDRMVYLRVEDIHWQEIDQPLKNALNKFNDKEKYPELVWLIQYSRQALAQIPNNKTFLDVLVHNVMPVIGAATYVTTCGFKLASGILSAQSSSESGLAPILGGIEVDKLWDAYLCVKESLEGWEISGINRTTWYVSLLFIDDLLLRGRLDLLDDLLGRIIKENKEPQLNEPFLLGLCDRFERLAYIQNDAQARDSALRLLKVIKLGEVAWAQGEAIQVYASQGLDRVALMWAPEIFKMEREGYAPPAWHPFWFAEPRNELLKQVQDNSLLVRRLVDSQQENIKKLQESYLKGLQQDREIKDALANYVDLEGTPVGREAERFDLKTKVQEYLDSEKKVLLLLGGAGSGKSTFNRRLAVSLWDAYTEGSALENKAIPVFIALSSLKRSNYNLVTTFFESQGFSKEQIAELQEKQRFVFILDGYDELEQRQRAFYKDNQLDEWKEAKIIISSRPEYLGPDYHYKFHPPGERAVLQEYQLAPFSEGTIEKYVDQYKKVHPEGPWSAEQYKNALNSSDLKTLVVNPFLLKIALSVLPELGQRLQDDGQHFTRIALYDEFVKSWFKRSQQRLAQIQLNTEEVKEFRRLEQTGFTDCGIDFSKQLALEMNQAGEVVSTYLAVERAPWRGSSTELSQDWRKQLLGNDNAMTVLMRLNAPLIHHGKQCRFIHKSIQDYLVARVLWEELEESVEYEKIELYREFNLLSDLFLLWENLADGLKFKHSSLFNRLNLVEDHAVRSFLVERLKKDPVLLQPLLSWVKASKIREDVNRAASNALTIVVKAGVKLSGLDLTQIKVPEADLSYGIFEETQFEGADLSGVKFQGTWLLNANLKRANLTRVDFGKMLPHLGPEKRIQFITDHYKTDGSWLATQTIFPGGKVKFYQTDTLILQKLVQSRRKTNGMTFSLSNGMSALGSTDGSVELRRVENGELLHTLTGHGSEISNISFANSNKIVASGSMDGAVKLWRLENGALLHTLTGHDSEISSISFSHIGINFPKSNEIIASGSMDGVMKLWRVENGELLHKLAGHDSGISVISFPVSNEIIASGSMDGVLKLWRVESGELLHTLIGHSSEVFRVIFSVSTNILVSESADSMVNVWEVVGGERLFYSLNYNNNFFLTISEECDDDTGNIPLEKNIWIVKYNATISWNIIRVDSLLIDHVDYNESTVDIYSMEDGMEVEAKFHSREGNASDLYWTPSHSALNVWGMSIQDARGLSALDAHLLKQRLATGEPLRTPEICLSGNLIV
ncbi:MAG: WD domain-containing protein, G-beta repeat-containing protein [Glomeribacter sp. 1016415]|nr:WD domain-containing protein, G-beta repeat-containing protein [Glomeribacter sp. 1016415]